MNEPPTINGRTLDTETELSIRGQTGRYKYRWMTGQDITCWGGRQGHEMYRSFQLNQIKTIHKKPKHPPRT